MRTVCDKYEGKHYDIFYHLGMWTFYQECYMTQKFAILGHILKFGR